MNTYAIKDIKDLFVLGRTTGERSPLTLFWTGSGIECNVKASELWIQVEADYHLYEPWISIFINGACVSRLMLTKGKQWICLFRGMNSEVTKNVKVLKDVQAMSGDPEHCLQIHGIRTDGIFEKVPDKPYRIEFIGDSITSGEGNIGAKNEEDWISMWFSTQNNYAVMTANALDADYHIISQSGWGVYTSWDNDPHGNIPDCYEKVCGLLTGERNRMLGANDAYDFQSWQPDIIVINLGTNDDGAFDSPEWIDPDTGKRYKQHRNEDGTYAGEDICNFEHAVIQFLFMLRKLNPNAQLLWVYGMIGVPIKEPILTAIEEYKKQSGDRLVTFLELPDTTKETIGARQHPGVLSHQKASEILQYKIRELL